MNMPLRTAIGFGLLGLASLSSAREPNPYAIAPVNDPVAALDRDSTLGRPGAEAAIQRWLEANPTAPAEQRAALYRRLCEIYGVRTWHAVRAGACRAQAALERRNKGDDDVGMAAALVAVPPIRVVESASIMLRDNPGGTKSADVTVNGVTLPWIVDTGAEISVLSQTSADRLGVRYVGGAVTVGTATADVAGRIAVIDLLRIGGSLVENVPVLVLPDARLTIAAHPTEPASTIPGILGLPVLAAFGRIAWIDGGSRLMMGELAPRVEGAGMPIYWHDRGLGIPVATDKGIVGAHFDTGANSTYLFESARPLLSEEIRTTGMMKTIRTGGAGGVVERRLAVLPRLPLIIGGVRTSLTNVTLAEDRERVARVGFDAVRGFRILILDFNRMVMSGEASTGN